MQVRCNDAPRILNVNLFDGGGNNRPNAVFSSKGVGEASIGMGTAVFFAVRDAITAARILRGLAPAVAAQFDLASPSTPARVRMAIDAGAESITTREPAVAQL